MIFEPSQNVTDSLTNIIKFGSAEVLQKIQEIPVPFWNIICLEILQSSESNKSEKTRAEKTLRSVLSDLENIECGINIFQKNAMGIFDFVNSNDGT